MLKTPRFRYCVRYLFAVPLQRKNQSTMRTTTTTIPTEMKVLMNHIYELHKGVRHMVLFTCNKKYGKLAVERLESQGIPYVLQPAGQQNLNVYFGRRECLEAIRLIVTRPLNQLTPEEDFILGAMLGYDLCAQCERYCKRKDSASREQSQACLGFAETQPVLARQGKGKCQGKCEECINRN
jgi:hypothetical protein